MRRLVEDATGYLGVSSVALAIDVILLTVLVECASVPYLAATTLSFCAGLLANYGLSTKWVFKHRRIKNRSVEFIGFATLGGIGILVNTVVMTAAVRVLGLHYLPAKGIAAACTFISNFFSRRQLLFVEGRATGVSEP